MSKKDKGIEKFFAYNLEHLIEMVKNSGYTKKDYKYFEFKLDWDNSASKGINYNIMAVYKK